MNKLQLQVAKARDSKFHLWLLNFGLLRTVPFNKPHGLKLVHIGDDELIVAARNIKPNQNHIRGIHACLLATLCEYVTGLSLLLRLDPKEYRIILKHINMTYHYQAKKEVQVIFKLTAKQFEEEVLIPLGQSEAIFKEFAVDVYDTEHNHICTGLINWQIKAWKNVRTQ